MLGILLRFGPQHGYQIRRTIAENVADFTRIKLPTIYYHLEKMEREGLVTANRETEGARPERTVYTVTPKGREAFEQGLKNQLALAYQPTFDADALFYFSDHLDRAQLASHLAAYVSRLEHSLTEIAAHLHAIAPYIPDDHRVSVDIIFNHHTLHYQAEKTWAQAALAALQAGGDSDAQAAGH